MCNNYCLNIGGNWCCNHPGPCNDSLMGGATFLNIGTNCPAPIISFGLDILVVAS